MWSPLLSSLSTRPDKHDLVLGPAHDGGYYLIGLRAPLRQLFRGIAWSTQAVLGQTVARARQLGLSTLLLPRLRDVDTASDARAAGILPGGTSRGAGALCSEHVLRWRHYVRSRVPLSRPDRARQRPCPARLPAR